MASFLASRSAFERALRSRRIRVRMVSFFISLVIIFRYGGIESLSSFLYNRVMKKKIIFSVLFVAFGMGFLGGTIGSVWWQRLGEAFPSTVTPFLSDGGGELIEARAMVSPAVFSLNEYRVKPELLEDFWDSPDRVGGGTGFLINASGLALTNKHVVPEEDHFYAAFLEDGTRFDVIVEARDALFDVALIRLVPHSPDSYAATLVDKLSFVQLGDSSSVKVGESVLAIGNSLSEYANTTTAGIVSAKGRQVVASGAAGATVDLSGLFQTDAAINFGNSGGPLVNLRGEVIAINTALDDEAQGIGFAIPINDVKPLVKSFQQYGEIRRPLLGVSYVMLTRAQIHELGLGLNQKQGALVVEVPGDAAAQAGLKEGDVIIAVNGVSLSLEFTLREAILAHAVGESVTLQVWRTDHLEEIQVGLTDLTESQ